jgi:hypothetical protein
MKPKILCLMLLVLMALAAIPAQAQTITIAAPGATAQQDVMVYYPNGTLQGVWNTSSTVILDANYSYIFSLKPQTNNLIDNPTDWLVNSAFPWVRTNILAIIIIFACIGILVRRS